MNHTYADIKDKIRTADLIFFKGTDIISKIVMCGEKFHNGNGDYSHVGICIRGESFNFKNITGFSKPDWLKDDKLYILEATISFDTHDVENKPGLCVQVRDMDEIINNNKNNHTMAWAKLSDIYRPTQIDARSELIQLEYNKYIGLYYDLSLIDLSSTIIPFIRKIRDNHYFKYIRDSICNIFYGSNRSKSVEDNITILQCDNYVSHWQFCSELVSNVYNDLKIFNVNAENIVPTDLLKMEDLFDVIIPFT